MTRPVRLLGETPVLVLAGTPGGGRGPELVGAALEAGAAWVAIPVERLPKGFLRLSTGVAGEIAQSCVNYRIGLAVLGDLGPAARAPGPLRDWVRESNRGGHVWFVSDEAELASRLARRQPG